MERSLSETVRLSDIKIAYVLSVCLGVELGRQTNRGRSSDWFNDGHSTISGGGIWAEGEADGGERIEFGGGWLAELFFGENDDVWDSGEEYWRFEEEIRY